MKLPLLLCGPIIRRATKEQITFWIATSLTMRIPNNEEPLFRVELFLLENSLTPAIPLPAKVSSATEVQLGERLFVSIINVKAQNEGQFPIEMVIGYDIFFLNRHPRMMAWLSFISPIRDQITLKHLNWPSFILQAEGKNDLRALYGSCRKLHGPGPDMMVAVEGRLQATQLDKDRPSVLLLGGDQIYADDVSDVLLGWIKKLGKTLIGRIENIPNFPKIDDIPPRARQRELQQQAKFTSDHAHNHLITFGEYAATYLLAWNEELWPRNLIKIDGQVLFDQMVDKEKEEVIKEMESDIDDDKFFPDERKSELENASDYFDRTFQKQIRNLKLARKGVRSARVALANIATYMIFDDHEITDDWYLNTEWTKNVLGTQSGRRIVANGLAGYWAFQGWGNNPDDFSKFFFDAITSFLLNEENPSLYEDVLINFLNWSYVAPTSPPTLVLNTRTRRIGSGGDMV